MNRLDTVEKAQMRESVPDFQPGDTVIVSVNANLPAEFTTRQSMPNWNDLFSVTSTIASRSLPISPPTSCG